jgi:amino acid transporter
MQGTEFSNPVPGTTVDLRRNSLSFPATLAQSIANIAPTVTPAMAVPLVAANAGNGTWLVYLIATFGLILVGLNVSTFARRFASAGSLYTYTAQSLGKTAGFLSGWSMLVAYLFTGMATLIAFTMFGQALLSDLGVHIPTLLLDAIGGALICLLGYRDIRFSSLLAMCLELASVLLIATFGVTILVKTGFHLDLNQLTLKGIHTSGLELAMILAVFSFVGFESSATLGKESRNPFRSIPRAIIVSTLGVGIFFALMAYVEVLGFPGGAAGLAKSGAPLTDLSAQYHLGPFGMLLNFGATLSFFSCTLASVNAAARVKFAMGRDRVLPASLGHVHVINRSPHKAVIVASIITFAIPALMSGIEDTDAYGYLGTIATYGFLFVYILISISSTVYMAREKMLRVSHVLLSFGGVLFMTFPVIGSFYPVPAAPYNWFPYAFIAYLVVGAIWVKIVRRKNVNARLMSTNFDVNDENASVG